MTIADLLPPDAVIELTGTRATEILAELSIPLARDTGLAASEIERILVAREGIGTTAVGEGCAIPHGRIEGLKVLVGAFGRSRAGIDFTAGDGKPVQLFFALLGPAGTPAPYLNALALVSRSFKDPARRQALLDAPDLPALHRVLAGTPDGNGTT